MKHDSMRKLVLGALLAALVFVATYVVQIPSPTQGYVNLGDCFVLLAGFLLGPWYGAAAGGIGSALTDLLAGYAHYVPGTFVIKALVAIVASLIYRAMHKKVAGAIVGGVLGEMIMVAGYFGYSGLILGKGLAAAASIPGNLVQGAVGLLAGVLLLIVVKRTNLETKI